MDASSSSSGGGRPWRTAFLTLRDETLTIPAASTLHSLLHNLIYSQSHPLISAAPHLPSHEVTSDVIFLLELVNKSVTTTTDDTLLHACHLIHDIALHIRLQINSSSWAIILDFLDQSVKCLFAKTKLVLPTADTSKAITEISQLLRNLAKEYGRKCLLSDNTMLLRLILKIVAFSSAELFPSSYSTGSKRYEVVDTNTKKLKFHNLWEAQIIAFRMTEETLSRIGSNLPPEMWQFTVEVLRNVMDALVSKSLLVEDSVMSRFYTSLLHCLHVVLSNPRGSLSDHVAGFVASLRMFFVYGLTYSPLKISLDTNYKTKEYNQHSHKSRLPESSKPEGGAYRPPHLRKREVKDIPSPKPSDSRSFSDNEPFALCFSSSDSEHSDSDGFGKDVDYIRSSKTRLAAIICIQDLCQVDLKAVTAHLTMLLPTNDVLQTRKYEATLMTCLLFDPVLKTRIASASALASMLTGPSSVFLQVAEYKESTKCGSFTALSSSLGQILMQLHSGILYLVKRETHNGLLVSLFKVLMLLISATPYARMPGELLPAVISTLRLRMIDGFPAGTDQSGLMAMLLTCLGAAFSTSPPSLQVKELLQEEVSTDLVGAPVKQSLLSLMFQFSERATNLNISFEALQVLRAVSHNYPNLMVACWGQVSSVTYELLKASTSAVSGSESSTKLLKGDVGNAVGSLGERCTVAAVKVLDECLRAISGFKGTEDILDDRSLDTPFTSDCTRTKRISSAPSYGLGSDFSDETPTEDSSGFKQWFEAIEKHLPLILLHSSAMVRAASVTCFAGITSSVFFSLSKEKQDYILSSSITAALHDEVPSVRSAACRAIGVIACFPQISQRADILDNFINAVETNTRDPLVSVRITASWALANICDLLCHRANDFDLDVHSSDSKAYSCWIALLAECALRLSKDGDKIKSNAVRALGNLSRFVRFASVPSAHNEACSKRSCPTLTTSNHNVKTPRDLLGDPHWLSRMVQAFVSCVTTGNVKVRWNVCHALSNLFLNETLKLEDMDWAPSVFSILLLLLRDSSNYKIRIHAAAALAVPSSRFDYGSSFSDVVQGLEHVLETLGSDQISVPSSLKYRVALEKQLTSSTLHVLSLVSCSDHEPLKDFLVKKASFLEDWLRALYSSVSKPVAEVLSGETERDGSFSSTQKTEMVQRTIKALAAVYVVGNKHDIARRLEKIIHDVPNCKN